MNPLRALLLATVLATLSLLFAAATAAADVEISRSGDTVTVQGSVFADDLVLGGTGSLFTIGSNSDLVHAGAGCTDDGIVSFSGNCGSGVATVNVDLRDGDDELVAIKVTDSPGTIFTTARGNGGADVLAGAANQVGGEGNDTLNGRPDGRSVLVGGNGDDTFNLATGRSEGVDGGPGLDLVKRCDRPVPAGTLAANVAKGAAKVAFKGAFGSKALSPGRYRATLTATAAGLASKPAATTFTVTT